MSRRSSAGASIMVEEVRLQESSGVTRTPIPGRSGATSGAPRPRSATPGSRRPGPGWSPCAPGRASQGCPGESRAPLGPCAVPGSVVLSGLGTGERPDEGHGPDAATRAGPGDRERPPQGRRRPLTGTAAARSGRACRSGQLWRRPARVLSRVTAGTCKPAALRNGQEAEDKLLVRPFCLGGEPPAPNTYMSNFSVRSCCFL